MADSIKIGNLDISAFKVGSSDCKIYLGDVKLYPSEEPTPQCNVPATATWHRVDNNYNRNTPIYGVSFASGDVYGGGYYQLEVKNQSNIIYSIECNIHSSEEDSDSDYITIYNNSDGSIYRQIDNAVVINSFCDVFGEPMYISDNAAIPSFEQCYEVDEETGECIDAYTEYFMDALY